MLSDQAVSRIEALAAQYPKGESKSAVVPALYVAQRDNGGWLPREAMTEVAEVLEIPASHVYGVASFYSMFYRTPVGKNVIQVCGTSPCCLRGAEAMIKFLEKKLGIATGETTEDGEFTLMEVECLAACDKAPMAQINEDYYENLDDAKVDEILAALRKGEKPAYAEFDKYYGNAHPVTMTDEELGISVDGITRADNIVKKQPEPTSAE
jgi:NADH-quinone oxidoreductase E subunit